MWCTCCLLIKDARPAPAQSEAHYVNETPAVIDGGRSPTEARAAAAATGGGAGSATTIITEVSTDLHLLHPSSGVYDYSRVFHQFTLLFQLLHERLTLVYIGNDNGGQRNKTINNRSVKLLIFWATVRKMVRPMLWDRCLSCLSVRCPVCLSVTLVYCGQTVGWIKISLGMEVGLGLSNIVLDGDHGDPAPATEKGTTALHFSAHVAGCSLEC